MHLRLARPLVIAAFAAVSAAAVAAPARCLDIQAQAVSDDELDDMRGGYLSADGIQFNFGALLQTMVNGQLAFQTQVSYSSAGEQVTQIVGSDVNNATKGATVTTGTVNNLPGSGLPPGSIVTLNNGATALIHNVTGGAVQNIVVNAANGQNITQSTQLQLQLPNFAQTQALFAQNLALLHLMQNAQAGISLGGH